MVSYKYWEDCVDPEDMEAMWMDPEVSGEWINAGESRERNVHLSRDPDGQVFLTQTEMRAVVGIIAHKHFASEIDQDMIRAIAELESDRQPLARHNDKKLKEERLGIMQILPQTAEWLISELGYRAYDIEGDLTLLHRPFVNVYLGSALLKWLGNYEGKERNEEFMVRAYRCGPKKANHKSTLDYWQRYIAVKQNLPARREMFENRLSTMDDSNPISDVAEMTGDQYWDSKVSSENMDEMWKHPDVLREWTRSGEIRGKVHFSLDAERRPYLSRLEMRAVADIIVSKYFITRGIKPSALCALAEVSSKRLVNGSESCTGIMGIDHDKAKWLHDEWGYNAYNVGSAEDLNNPFVSVYFGAAYLVSLSQYEGRDRNPQFVIQAYLGGPENVKPQEMGPLWVKFEEALCHYHDRRRREQGSCSVM